MDYAAPFLTDYWDNPDFNSFDAESAFNLMVTRNRAIDSMLHGELRPDECLDLLGDSGIDVDEYIELTTANMESIVNRGLTLQGCPFVTN